MQKISREELKLVASQSEIRMQHAETQPGYEFYTPKYLKDICVLTVPTYKNMQIKVTQKSTLDAIFDFHNNSDNKDYTLGVLNFASPTKPGGGWKNGVLAQEETLARNSDLMTSLNQGYNDYYIPNKKKKGIGSSDIIYSKNVQFWSNEKIEDENPFIFNSVKANVITCAAPNKNKISSLNLFVHWQLNNIYLKRIDNILRIAKLKDINYLVLGAWGCGVFGNDTKTIAKAFKKVITEKYPDQFAVIELAIYDKDHDTPNFKIFQEVFNS